MKEKRLRQSLLLLFISWPLLFAAPARAEIIRVAAASDLNYALSEIAASFEKEQPHILRISFGSSGQFAAQIQQGAPFEIFLSADESYVQRLAKAKLTHDQGILYAVGRIVLFAPLGSPLKPQQGFADLKRVLKQGKLKHLAIANPDHAPYGRAAREALMSQGLWPLPTGVRLILGENASQAAQFTLSGSVEAGIIPYSLALAPVMTKRGCFYLIPENLHNPLTQRMVLLKSAGAPAQIFYRYLQGAKARAIFSKYGFVLPP